MRISDWSSDVCSSDLGRRWASSDDVAMVSTPDPAAYEAILRRGRSALAWEVLRRNPAYRAAYADLPVLPPTGVAADADFAADRSEEHTSELQSLMRTPYASFSLKTKKKTIFTEKHIA